MKRTEFILIILCILVIFTWSFVYFVGFLKFDKNNVTSIYGSVIQGMSALLAVAIAVIIFRIQTLENRNQSLEQSTLNYIYQITGITFPQWIPSVEDDIESGNITNRYYNNRVQRAQAKGDLTPEYQQALAEDKDTQQKRLMEVLNLYRNTASTIRKTREKFLESAFLLIAPIISSLLMFMMSDALNSYWNFLIIALVVLMSAIGIIWLINVVLISTRKA